MVFGIFLSFSSVSIVYDTAWWILYTTTAEIFVSADKPSAHWVARKWPYVMFFHLPELDSEMTSEASRSALEAFCSPSAAITWNGKSQHQNWRKSRNDDGQEIRASVPLVLSYPFLLTYFSLVNNFPPSSTTYSAENCSLWLSLCYGTDTEKWGRVYQPLL